MQSPKFIRNILCWITLFMTKSDPSPKNDLNHPAYSDDWVNDTGDYAMS